MRLKKTPFFYPITDVDQNTLIYGIMGYWNSEILGNKMLRLRCHPEQGEGSLTCPPHSYGRRGFFTESVLIEILQSLCSFRMTTSEGFRITFLSLSLNLDLSFPLF
jgi:hypothetical protein